MRSRFAIAALMALAVGVQPAMAQQAETELKKAQEQLEKLLKELKEREAKKAEAPKPPVPPSPPAPPKPTITWTQLQPGDATGPLKGLTASKDPKVAALARELLELLNKVPSASKANELHLQLAKPVEGGTFELKATPATAGQYQFKVLPVPGAAGEPKTIEKRIVVVGEGDGKPMTARVFVEDGKRVEVTRAAVAVTTPASGTSTLKLSADGKTAALLAADGTITIFDVATGKEVMKFAGKK